MKLYICLFTLPGRPAPTNHPPPPSSPPGSSITISQVESCILSSFWKLVAIKLLPHADCNLFNTYQFCLSYVDTSVDHAVDGVSLETAATHNFQIPDVVLSLQESLWSMCQRSVDMLRGAVSDIIFFVLTNGFNVWCCFCENCFMCFCVVMLGIF